MLGRLDHDRRHRRVLLTLVAVTIVRLDNAVEGCDDGNEDARASQLLQHQTTLGMALHQGIESSTKAGRHRPVVVSEGWGGDLRALEG